MPWHSICPSCSISSSLRQANRGGAMSSSTNAEAAKKPPRPEKQIVIHIDRKPFKVDEGAVTGSAIRALPDPDVGLEFDLWLEVPGGEDERVDNDETVKLRNGMHFFTAPSVINPGRSC